MTYPNTVVHTYHYDTLNRLRTLDVTLGAASLHSYDYKLKPSGHPWQVVEGLKTTTYDYDDLHRLRGETVANDPHGNNGAITYDLDKVGNRLNRFSQLAAVSSQLGQTYNVRDWLDRDTYTANGSTQVGQLADPAAQGTDSYDFEERLIVRTKPDGSTINVSYDADGNRIQKALLDAASILTSSTTWLVDTNNLTGYAQAVEERTSAVGATPSSSLRVYTYGTDLISQATSVDTAPVVVNYYCYDGHGSVRELSDATGAVTDRCDYDAFGNVVAKTGATSNAYLYCGEQFDGDLGLYFNRARYLSADSGRFWSLDKYEGRLREPIGIH